MSFRTIFISLSCGFMALVLMGNRNGRAASQGMGNTGAPGDETIGGTPRTCVGCHNGGPIVASLALQVLDDAGNSVTQYTPGKQYTAKVTITASGNANLGYGFQMIALRDNGNVDLDGFTDPSTTNNFKIATIANGRTYAEHNGISTPNTFEVPWKAPAAGTGNVTFYAAGNGVNRNNNSSGDGAAAIKLQMTEATTADKTPELVLPLLELAPNPAVNHTRLRIQVEQTGTYQIAAFDLSGRSVWTTARTLSEGHPSDIDLDVANWPRGLFLLRISDEQGRQKVLRMVAY